MNKSLQRLAAVALIVGVGLTATFGPQKAQAVSADTTIQIDFPTILVLYHYNNITLDVSQTDLAAALGAVSAGASCVGDFCVQLTGPGAISWDMNPAILDAGMDVDPGVPTLATLGSVNLEINNAWGVRSIGAGSLTASVAGADLTNGTDTLAVTMAGAGGAGTNDTSPATGLTLQTGDIDFDLDLSTLDSSGSYTADFTITVTNP